MKGVLVDTSIWIDFFNGIETKEVELLINYIESDFPVYICPIILQEILQGFGKDRDYKLAGDLLLEFPILEVNPIDSALGAAGLYRMLRKKGVTIRKSNDCLIAYYAITHNLPILYKDRDFSIIAENSALKIIEA